MSKQKEISMLETIEGLMEGKKKPQKFANLAEEVLTLMGVSDEDKFEMMAQLYTDLSLSGKFVALGDDLWDLKSRQPFDVAEYDTYDLDFEPEEEVTLLGEDVPGILPKDDDDDDEDEDEDESEEESVDDGSDDYSDESDANAKDDDLKGLAIVDASELEE